MPAAPSRAPSRRFLQATIVTILALGALALPPLAASTDPDDAQHGGAGGHLAPSSANVDLVGRVDLTSVPGGVADVGALGEHAYVAAFRPECGGAGGGVHVVDVGDPERPEKVAFIPAPANSYVGEGIHAIRIDTAHFSGDVLLHNNEPCDTSVPFAGGASLWDVTDPEHPVALSASFGDATPAVPRHTFHATHSAFAWTTGPNAYAVLQDNNEGRDVDVFDITDPRNPVLLAEVGWEDWPGAAAPLAHGSSVLHHDVVVEKVRGKWLMLLSYWDAGFIVLDVTDPASPAFVSDSDPLATDPLTGFSPEGNAHQAVFSGNGKMILGTDEDFSPYRTLFRVTSGPHAGAFDAGEFSWTVPFASAYPAGFAGEVVFGGSGCAEDLNGNGVSDADEVPSAASTGAEAVVFSRGACFFSTKVESGQDAGYGVVLVGQSHGGSRGGLLADGFTCGSMGHSFVVTSSGGCVGHRAMHLLFDDAPAYTGPEGYAAGGDLPAIGTLGASVSIATTFDGWGYVHLLDTETMEEIDAYAVPESLDEAYASGFGALTVHELKIDPREDVNLAYASYYDAGLRVLAFGKKGLDEVGHYVADGGSDYWGVFPLAQGNEPPLLLVSDRDSGLAILRYTGG